LFALESLQFRKSLRFNQLSKHPYDTHTLEVIWTGIEEQPFDPSNTVTMSADEIENKTPMGSDAESDSDIEQMENVRLDAAAPKKSAMKYFEDG